MDANQQRSSNAERAVSVGGEEEAILFHNESETAARFPGGGAAFDTDDSAVWSFRCYQRGNEGENKKE